MQLSKKRDGAAIPDSHHTLAEVISLTSEPSIHTIAKTVGEHKGRLRLRDERECSHRLERLPDRRKGGRMSAREHEGKGVNTGWEKHLKSRRDSAKRAAARMVVIGERAFCSCAITWQSLGPRITSHDFYHVIITRTHPHSTVGSCEMQGKAIQVESESRVHAKRKQARRSKSSGCRSRENQFHSACASQEEQQQRRRQQQEQRLAFFSVAVCCACVRNGQSGLRISSLPRSTLLLSCFRERSSSVTSNLL